MDRLKNPALWCAFVVALCAALIHSAIWPDGSLTIKLLTVASEVAGVAGSLFFGAGIAAARSIPPAALLLLALPLLACGHAAQAARGTFATLAAAEHSYARWATAEVDRLVAQARTDCPKEPDRAACAERITGPTFRNLEITDAALVSYHEAQRAASICLAKGGDVAACTTASVGAASKLLEQLGGLGFEVRQ